MLAELTITDFAIIDHLHLELAPGFIVFTGETGAGKSIIIDAVELLLGGRAEATQVRGGAEVARIEARFHLGGATAAAVRAILQREELLDEPDGPTLEVTLGREVRREGRSLGRVNGRGVGLALLKEIGQGLVDVHGQSEHLSLLRPREHLFLLDRFAELEAEREALAETVGEVNALRQELAELRQAERDRERRLDMLNFQIDEIAAAKLKPGEDAALLQERTRLANAEKLAALADEALRALTDGSEDTPSAADLIGTAGRALAGLTKLDAALAPHRDTAQALSVQFKELAYELRAYRDRIEYNPKRLDAVEERLELIKSLQRKYGQALEAILAFAEQARAERETLTHSGERAAELQAREDQLLRRVGQAGARLSAARLAAGEHLARAIETELNDLRMERARFGVDQQWTTDPAGAYVNDRRVAFDGTGLDQLEFLVAPNVGEDLKPLVKVASGGETARLMLALKGVLARADQTPTLIFDEIDQGIGGRVGAVVGRKLWSLAETHQVLCITHLPQLAGFGDQHFKVEKVLSGDRTVTRVQRLNERARVAELAQMLGGAGAKTRDSAEEILEMVRAEKLRAR